MRRLFRKTPGWPRLIHVGLQISDVRRWLDRDRMSDARSYAASLGVDAQRLNLGSGANPTCPATMPAGSNCQFPDVTTRFQRLDATAIFKFDQDIVMARLGKSQLHVHLITASLSYTW